MKKRRLIVTLFTFLVAIVVTVSTGFSIFYLNSAQTTDQAPIKVDDIEENYALADSLNNEDYYDVYFFVDETYARQNLSVDGMISIDPSNEFGWIEPNDNVTYYDNREITYYKSGEFLNDDDEKPPYKEQKNNAAIGWAKLTVYRSISVEQFNSLGTPVTKRVDNNGWVLMFSGWTANKSAASNCISHRQGNFDYVDAFSSLQVIDSQSTDGSEANDHVVFLYPIWTTGKDYSQTDTTQQQVVVRLFGDNNELYFSQDGNYNDAHYTYKNLTLENDDALDDYRLEVSVMGWQQDRLHSSVYSKSWKGPWYDNENTGPLFNSPGTYNIHAFVFNQIFESGDVQHRSYNDYFNYISDTELENCFNLVKGVIVNTLTIQYQGNNIPLNINWGADKTGNSTFVCYVLIERVYEFKVLGGPFSTFYYEDKSTRHFFDGQIFEDNFDSSIDDSEEYSVEYGLNNVFIDTAHEFTDTHVISERNQVTGVFKSNVFTIDFWDGLWHSTITSFSDDELASINSFNNTDQYQTISDDGLLQRAKPQTEGDPSTISDDYDYHLTTNAEALRDMLKITETGLYNFRIQVVYERMTYGSSSEGLTNYVRRVKIAIAPVENEYFVKIFQKDNFRYYEHRNENNGIDQYTNTGFVDHFSGNYQDNALLQHLVFNQQRQFAGTMQTVDNGVFDVDSYLNKLASQNQALFDHVTGEQVTSGFLLDRNHIFYIASI